MKKQFLFIGIVGLTALMLSSCATMFSGTTQHVSFNSEPQGAAVSVDGQTLCFTPCIANVQRSSTSVVTFTKDSYKRGDAILNGTFNPTTIWNVLWGYGVLVAIPIDAITGAIWRYNFPSVYVKLSPENGGYAPAPQQEVQDKPSSKAKVNTSATASDKLKVAVFTPTATADVPEDMKAIVLAEVNSAVANAFGYALLERGQVDSVLVENKSAQVDEKEIGALGQKMGADKVCVTHISKLGDAYHISCKLIDAATARIDSQKTGKTVSGGDNIDDVVIDIVVSMLRQY